MYHSGIPPLVAGATIFPPLAGEVRRSRIGGGERSEPIRRMLFMPYDIESQSRNADFISIARRAIRNPRGQRPRQTYEPLGQRPIHLKNPFYATLLHNPPPAGGHNPRGEAPSTLTPQACHLSSFSRQSRNRSMPLDRRWPLRQKKVMVCL